MGESIQQTHRTLQVTTASTVKFSAINFTCPNCGAPMVFSPASGNLQCKFCDTQSTIENHPEAIKTHDYNHTRTKHPNDAHQEIEKSVSCVKCGSSFTLAPSILSSNCPYCQTPAITECVRAIKPESLLAFQITQQEAKERFKHWVGSLWFAPTAFTKYFRSDRSLEGHYLPYWAYDSNTFTQYEGLRGDTYYVTVTKNVVRNGKTELVEVQEARIKWTPASGSVSLSFNDITVGAYKSLPRSIIDAIEPWNTQSLKSYSAKYLSGFQSQEYTIGLEEAFSFAKTTMKNHIEYAIRRDIGGDQQRITHTDIHYSDIAYKNTLFPLWTATFKWKDKIYYYAINAQTGKVDGERPYSIMKIIIAIGIVAIIVAGAFYYDHLQR